jgi:hypothetical protein
MGEDADRARPTINIVGVKVALGPIPRTLAAFLADWHLSKWS